MINVQTEPRTVLEEVACGQPALLEPRFVTSGTVIHGAKLGRTLSFPTANIELASDRRPERGIYAAFARVDRAHTYLAAAYFGERPTVGGEGERLETHLFEFNKDIYGCVLEVELVALIRGDFEFASISLMLAQMRVDCMRARQVLMQTYPRMLLQAKAG